MNVHDKINMLNDRINMLNKELKEIKDICERC